MSSTDPSPSIQKIVRLTAKAGRDNELLLALRLLEAETVKEMGCVEFTLLQSISEPTSFVLLEHFTSLETFRAHLKLPHTIAFFEAQLVAASTATDVPSLGSPGASADGAA